MPLPLALIGQKNTWGVAFPGALSGAVLSGLFLQGIPGHGEHLPSAYPVLCALTQAPHHLSIPSLETH